MAKAKAKASGRKGKGKGKAAAASGAAAPAAGKASSAAGQGAGSAVDPGDARLEEQFDVVTRAERLVLLRLPAGVDPAELDGAEFPLDTPGEAVMAGVGAGRRLRVNPEPVSSSSSGAGKPVVVIRRAAGGPLLPVAAFSHRVVVTEDLSVCKPALPAPVAQGAAQGPVPAIKQMEGLDYRYVPFGAAAPAERPRKRKRKEHHREGKVSSKHDHDKKKKKKKTKAKPQAE